MRLLRHPLLTVAGNALTIWSIGVFLITVGVAGGIIWTFSAFPLAFKLLTLVGVLLLCAVALAATAPRMRDALSGVQLSMRESVISLEWEKKKGGDLNAMGFRTAGPVSTSFASVLVFNAQDAGGAKAVARDVVPQVEIFEHDGRRVFNHVGWDTGSARDFRPTREEHRLYIAGKWKESEDFHPIVGTPLPGTISGRTLGGPTYDVLITLRGENLKQPITKAFLLANRGAGHHLQLTSV